MGRFMIHCCCVCGASPRRWHDEAWELAGGIQDFCPAHALPDMTEFTASHLSKIPRGGHAKKETQS